MVVRIPGGFFKCGDPWHSQTNEVQFVHAPGWKVAVPSNAEDAVGRVGPAFVVADDLVSDMRHRCTFARGHAHKNHSTGRGVNVAPTADRCRSGGRGLRLARGMAQDVLPALVKQANASAVYWNAPMRWS